jgi:hypothetical protein
MIRLCPTAVSGPPHALRDVHRALKPLLAIQCRLAGSLLRREGRVSSGLGRVRTRRGAVERELPDAIQLGRLENALFLIWPWRQPWWIAGRPGGTCSPPEQPNDEGASGRYRRHQRRDADNVRDPRQIVGEHAERHLRRRPSAASSSGSASHPLAPSWCQRDARSSRTGHASSPDARRAGAEQPRGCARTPSARCVAPVPSYIVS